MDNTQSTYVVIGASGGIGNAVTRNLVAQGKAVRAVNRSGVIDISEGVETFAANENLKDIRVERRGLYIYGTITPDLNVYLPKDEIRTGIRYRKGVYTLPTAVLGFCTRQDGQSLLVLKPDGTMHHHPHVRAGGGDGRVCWGEVEEDTIRHTRIVNSLWSVWDVDGIVDFMKGFLTTFYPNDRYSPLFTLGTYNEELSKDFESRTGGTSA